MSNAKFRDMPQAFKGDYKRISHGSLKLLSMFRTDVYNMQTFKDWSDTDIKLITAPNPGPHLVSF